MNETTGNIIPMLDMKNTYITQNGHGQYDVTASPKEEMLLMQINDKQQQQHTHQQQKNVDDDANNVAPQSTWRLCSTISILLLANILNYMDRYTIAGE